MQKRGNHHGFTVVELAVVIVVIAVLVTLTAVGYRAVQNRAYAANVMTALRTVESAFQAFSAHQNRETWVNATQFHSTTEANLSMFLAPSYTPSSGQTAISELRRHLPKGAPTVDGATIEWGYRNNGSERLTTACDTAYTGAILVLSGVPSQVFAQLDKEYDDAAPTCGTLRYNAAGDVLYQLGFAQRITN